MPTREDDRRQESSGVVRSRRGVLASVAVLASSPLPGCPVPGGAGEKTALRLREPEPPGMGVAVTEAELRDDQVALVERAAADGRATAHGYDPFEDEDYVRVDGTYYRVRTDEGSLERVAAPVLVVDPVTATADAVPLEEYDGHVIELVAPLAGNDTHTLVLHPDVSGFEALHPEPSHEYVTWENGTYRLTVEQRRVEQRARHVRVEAVATRPAEFGDYLRETAVDVTVDPDELSDRGREIVGEAIEGEYEEEAPYSDAFESVLETLRGGTDAETATAEWGAAYLVVYDGTLYRVEIRTRAWG